MRIRQKPLWLWNPEMMSPEMQNKVTSGPKMGHVYVSAKTLKTKSCLDILQKKHWTHEQCFFWNDKFLRYSYGYSMKVAA